MNQMQHTITGSAAACVIRGATVHPKRAMIDVPKPTKKTEEIRFDITNLPSVLQSTIRCVHSSSPRLVFIVRSSCRRAALFVTDQTTTCKFAPKKPTRHHYYNKRLRPSKLGFFLDTRLMPPSTTTPLLRCYCVIPGYSPCRICFTKNHNHPLRRRRRRRRGFILRRRGAAAHRRAGGASICPHHILEPQPSTSSKRFSSVHL